MIFPTQTLWGTESPQFLRDREPNYTKFSAFCNCVDAPKFVLDTFLRFATEVYQGPKLGKSSTYLTN